MSQNTYTAHGLELSVLGDLGAFNCSFNVTELSAQHFLLGIELEASQDAPAPDIEIAWCFPGTAALCRWTTRQGASHHLPADWQGYTEKSQATAQAPVVSFFHPDGTNRFTMAFSDALHPVQMKAGINEEQAQVDCRIKPFGPHTKQQQKFNLSILIDQRSVPYYQSLKDVSDWWASLPGYQPCAVPNVGKLPMYSTWYSFHQKLTSAEIEKQCVLAKELGCAAVIVDDGWQTKDSNRGYAFTGDWKPERLSDMPEHVQRVHDIDMQYMLWYSVPYVGFDSDIYSRFKGKYLYEQERSRAAVFDPRYSDVREYLISIYEAALREWKLDGFKLDFVDCFYDPGEDMPDAAEGRDFSCVYEAADQLMRDVYDRLHALNNDVLIEFRQSYIGPLMRRYGNLFRAGDCPMDAIMNRVRTIDIRLLAGTTATHADMIMWHPHDSVENAALQLLNVFFSVPQISVLLDKIPESHQTMLRHYLNFWIEHRACLLDGQLVPLHPEQNYPLVSSYHADECVTLAFAQQVISFDDQSLPHYYVINASGEDGVYVQAAQLGNKNVAIYDCCGTEVSSSSVDFSSAVQQLKIPASGMACIS